MLMLIEQVLSAEALDEVRTALATAEWRDGASTAGTTAKAVKNNLQAAGLESIRALITKALLDHPVFKLAARPAALSRILLSRYEPGMEYGPHTDNAIMSLGERSFRADVAFTLFLADPASYEGGELTILFPAGNQIVKLPAGAMVVYPAGTIHFVAPVTRGERLAAVGWAQSQVRDPAQRELLFDLGTVRAHFKGDDRQRLLMDKTIANLLRMWAEL